VARLAKSYHLDDAKPPEEMKIGQFRYPYTDPTREPEGGGGLFGTADDLCRFFRMLAAGGTAPDGRRILSEQLQKGRQALAYLSSVAVFLEKAETEEDLEGLRAELRKTGYLKSAPQKGKQPQKNSPEKAETIAFP
jgi:CubicO group peptidase (beta-lactamase class C family)